MKTLLTCIFLYIGIISPANLSSQVKYTPEMDKYLGTWDSERGSVAMIQDQFAKH